MAGKDNLDDLMSGLLNEAKQGVEAEGKKIDAQHSLREQAERDAKQREENKKRDEAQQRVIEESRRRNEALARRDRDVNERKVSATAKHARVEPVEAPVAAPVVLAAAPKPTSKLLLAGLVAGGLAIGAGGAFAMAPERKGTFPDVDDAARVVVIQTARAALAEQKLNGQLSDLNGQLTSLQKDANTSGSDMTKLKGELDKLKGELAKAKKDLDDVKSGSGKKGTTGTADDGVPKLDNSAFGSGKKNP